MRIQRHRTTTPFSLRFIYSEFLSARFHPRLSIPAHVACDDDGDLNLPFLPCMHPSLIPVVIHTRSSQPTLIR